MSAETAQSKCKKTEYSRNLNRVKKIMHRTEWNTHQSIQHFNLTFYTCFGFCLPVNINVFSCNYVRVQYFVSTFNGDIEFNILYELPGNMYDFYFYKTCELLTIDRAVEKLVQDAQKYNYIAYTKVVPWRFRILRRFVKHSQRIWLVFFTNLLFCQYFYMYVTTFY